MTTSDKLLVVQTEDRVVRVQKLGMEDDLDAILWAVEQLHSPDLAEDRVAGVIRHVVRDDWREGVSLEGEHTALQEDFVLGVEQAVRVRDFGAVLAECQQLLRCLPVTLTEGSQSPNSPRIPRRVLEDPLADPGRHLVDSLPELLRDRLPLQSLDGVRVGGSRHDDERHHRQLGPHLLQSSIESCVSASRPHRAIPHHGGPSNE